MPSFCDAPFRGRTSKLLQAVIRPGEAEESTPLHSRGTSRDEALLDLHHVK